MKYQHGQEIECIPLFPMEQAVGRWQKLASALELEVIAKMLPPQSELYDPNKYHTPGGFLLNAACFKSDGMGYCTLLSSLFIGLNIDNNPFGLEVSTDYSERRAYFWQELYNILGYLWSLDDEVQHA